MDEIISQSVKDLVETITQPSLINLDHDVDVKAIMREGGISCMLLGEASRSGDTPIVKRVVEAALDHSLLEIDRREASGALIHITGGNDMTSEEFHQIIEGITEAFGSGMEGNVLYGVGVLPEMKDRIKVMAIITGVHSPKI